MKLLKTSGFSRWAKKEKILDSQLGSAIDTMNQGASCADLGGGLIKLRLARRGQGKRSGHRVLLTFKQADRLIFLFGFSKKDCDNLDEVEKKLYKKLAKYYLSVPLQQLEKLRQSGELVEVEHDKPKK